MRPSVLNLSSRKCRAALTAMAVVAAMLGALKGRSGVPQGVSLLDLLLTIAVSVMGVSEPESLTNGLTSWITRNLPQVTTVLTVWFPPS